jgi:hypothetical protein
VGLAALVELGGRVAPVPSARPKPEEAGIHFAEGLPD